MLSTGTVECATILQAREEINSYSLKEIKVLSTEVLTRDNDDDNLSILDNKVQTRLQRYSINQRP